MRKIIEARYHAIQQVILVLEKYSSIYAGVAILVGAIAELKVLVEELAGFMVKVESFPSVSTGNKSLIHAELSDSTFKLSNVLLAYANINADENMKNYLISSESVINDRLRDQQLFDYAKGVEERIALLGDALTPYGVSDELKVTLTQCIESFAEVTVEPRQLINDRKTTNELLLEKISEASTLITERIDTMVELFKDNNPFYLEYKNARMIVNPATRHRDSSEEESDGNEEES